MSQDVEIEKLKFLNETMVRELLETHGTPIYIYSKTMLKQAADQIKEVFSVVSSELTVRYAMKANPHPDVIKTLYAQGIKIDASSEYEAKEALDAGVDPVDILLTSQQLPKDMAWIGEAGVNFTATSLHQLEEYGKNYPSSSVSVRLNTGLGSGANHRLTTGGIEVGFGIWFHEGDDRGQDILAIAKKYQLTIERVHIHIGTGSDPEIWERLMHSGIRALETFKDASILNLGGGFKLPYMEGDKGADMHAIGMVAQSNLQQLEKKSGRSIHFEIEPGRFLAARCGALITSIIDRTDTGEHGDDFLKIDSGMNDILRTPMYGAQHPLVTVSKIPSNAERPVHKYVVIGHCCESGDVLTTKPGDPELIDPRPLSWADIGDYMVIEMAGAYCAGMRAQGYNSFPSALEIIVD